MRSEKEDLGRRCLDVFREFPLECHVGGSLNMKNFWAKFAQFGWGNPTDIADGLEFAISQNWIERTDKGVFTLTETGLREINLNRY